MTPLLARYYSKKGVVSICTFACDFTDSLKRNKASLVVHESIQDLHSGRETQTNKLLFSLCNALASKATYLLKVVHGSKESDFLLHLFECFPLRLCPTSLLVFPQDA
jgi:hypothetical protein